MQVCVTSAARLAEIALQDVENTVSGARGSTSPMRSRLIYKLAEYEAILLAVAFKYQAAGGCGECTDLPFEPRHHGGPGDMFAASVVLFDQSLKHLLKTLAYCTDVGEERRVLDELAHTNVESIRTAASQDVGAKLFAAGRADFCVAANALRALACRRVALCDNERRHSGPFVA